MVEKKERGVDFTLLDVAEDEPFEDGRALRGLADKVVPERPRGFNRVRLGIRGDDFICTDLGPVNTKFAPFRKIAPTELFEFPGLRVGRHFLEDYPVVVRFELVTNRDLFVGTQQAYLVPPDGVKKMRKIHVRPRSDRGKDIIKASTGGKAPMKTIGWLDEPVVREELARVYAKLFGLHQLGDEAWTSARYTDLAEAMKPRRTSR